MEDNHIYILCINMEATLGGRQSFARPLLNQVFSKQSQEQDAAKANEIFSSVGGHASVRIGPKLQYWKKEAIL